MNASPEPSLAVRMAGVTKRYPGTVANADASLEVQRGEVHAVVGENGAGKSTLMKVLYGIVSPDEGRIEVLGRTLTRHSPSDAIRAGLGMVFQHFVLVPTLSVAENIVLGHEPRRGFFVDLTEATARVERLSKEYALPIDPTAPVHTCSVGLQQRIEILKVLYRGAEVLILDEPTAVLTPQEVDELILVLERLKESGKTVILITHKMREVMAAADRVTIMRRGRTIETLEVSCTTPAEIAEKTIGRAPAPPSRPEKRVRRDPPLLEVRGLTARSDRGALVVRGIDLTVGAGEIVGVAGIEGNGQVELVECLAGLRRVEAGAMSFSGQPLDGLSVRRRGDFGLAHVPADRHQRAVVLEFSVEENAVLGLVHKPEFSSAGFLRLAAQRRHAEAIIAATDLRPNDPRARFSQLSGGNQQKLVVGRELTRAAKLLLACHPTRGLDVGAAEFVLERLLAERARGAGVLFVSAELSELLAISDRIVVVFGGKVAGELDPENVDERRIGLLMAGQAA
ncbi:MAG: ABC transporter ATP-binding protein [Deltaproteobacteria bacterium]|nr:ABC transporter ATP-binding protein [Deltaproteobacteria bacterium]